MGAHSRVEAYVQTAKNIIRANFLLLLEAGQSMLEYVVLEAISKPEYADNTGS